MRKLLFVMAALVASFAMPHAAHAQGTTFGPVVYQSYAPSGACTLPNYLTVQTAGTSAGTYQCIAGVWQQSIAAAGVTSINTASGAFTFGGNGVNCVLTTCTFNNVTSINSVSGAFTFTGTGVTCTSTTCTFNASSGTGTVSGQIAGRVPVASSATALTAPSSIADNGTTVSTTESIQALSFTSTDTSKNTSVSFTQAAGGVDVLPTQATGFDYLTFLGATGVNLAHGTGSFSPLVRQADIVQGAGITVTPSGNTVTIAATGASGIANIQVTLPTTAISANTCTTPATATMTGVATTSVFDTAFATNPNAVTGWGATGGLTFTAWPTANTLNWSVCNQTAASITPGAMTLNVGAR